MTEEEIMREAEAAGYGEASRIAKKLSELVAQGNFERTDGIGIAVAIFNLGLEFDGIIKSIRQIELEDKNEIH